MSGRIEIKGGLAAGGSLSAYTVPRYSDDVTVEVKFQDSFATYGMPRLVVTACVKDERALGGLCISREYPSNVPVGEAMRHTLEALAIEYGRFKVGLRK